MVMFLPNINLVNVYSENESAQRNKSEECRNGIMSD